MSQSYTVPVVMTLAGNDPSGGAGLQADIEAIASMGCHAAPVVTALTVQDTCDVLAVVPIDPDLVYAQARTVLNDAPVAAIKIGLLGSPANAEIIAELLEDYPHIPLILDPVLAAGGGRDFDGDALADAIRRHLLARTTVLTPNSVEARRLAPAADTLDACAQALLDTGCAHVLITGTHEATDAVVNRLYGDGRLLDSWTWERLPHDFHGSGCTLAAALAGLLAQGNELHAAVAQAQEYTWEALRGGYRIGAGQRIPNRLFWADEDGADD
ncbi:MAG: hydroxymethylpyrimidine/phosphomethylpyrimidine kinase [Proteobacteria bacterium]|nr:hydroxymethylpyrimidine/phosphomethylpyrimidine kinase [Pseudomonadota bacterium]